MRFGLRAKSCANVNDVKTSLISSRRIVFTPTVDLKDELAGTTIQITCFDRNGNEVKRVTSADPGTVEDPEQEGGASGGEEGAGENTGESGSQGAEGGNEAGVESGDSNSGE